MYVDPWRQCHSAKLATLYSSKMTSVVRAKSNSFKTSLRYFTISNSSLLHYKRNTNASSAHYGPIMVANMSARISKSGLPKKVTNLTRTEPTSYFSNISLKNNRNPTSTHCPLYTRTKRCLRKGQSDNYGSCPQHVSLSQPSK